MATHSGSLENPMDRRAWLAIVLGVAKSWTQLSDKHFHTFHLGSYKTLCHQILSLSLPLTCIKHLLLLKTGGPNMYFIEIYLFSHFPLWSLIIYIFWLSPKKKTPLLQTCPSSVLSCPVRTLYSPLISLPAASFPSPLFLLVFFLITYFYQSILCMQFERSHRAKNSHPHLPHQEQAHLMIFFFQLFFFLVFTLYF